MMDCLETVFPWNWPPDCETHCQMMLYFPPPDNAVEYSLTSGVRFNHSLTFPVNMAPAGYSPTSIFFITSAGRPTSPLTPWTPCLPCGPVSPVSPLGPWGPTAPVSPFIPCLPCGPVSPVSPLSPLGPLILPIRSLVINHLSGISTYRSPLLGSQVNDGGLVLSG